MDRVFAYRFTDYWQDVGTIASYWEANMGLLNDPADFEMYDYDWVIHTRSEERPPAKIGAAAKVSNSLISHGCHIVGTVEHSVLSPGVFVAEGAVVRDSIVMNDTIVGRNAVVDCSILDKEVVIGAGAVHRLRRRHDAEPDGAEEPLDRASRWSASGCASRPGCGSAGTCGWTPTWSRPTSSTSRTSRG